MPLDKDTLKALLANKTLSLSALRPISARAAEAVLAKAGEGRKQVLVDTVRNGSDAMRRAVESIPNEALDSDDAETVVLRALEGAQVSDAEKAVVLDRLLFTRFVNERIEDADLPVILNPTVHAELEKAAVLNLGEALQLKPEIAAALSDYTGDLEGLDDDAIDDLVGQQKLTEDEGKTLGSRIGLVHLTGNADIATALAGQAATADVRALAGMDPDVVLKTLRDSTIAAPDGQTLEGLSATIIERANEEFPHEAIRARLAPPPEDAFGEAVRRAAPVLTGDGVIRDADTLDLSAIPEADRRTVAAAHADVARTVRRYPGLGLEAIVARGGDAAAIAKEVGGRIALVDRVVRENPDVEFLALDYAPDSEDMRALNTTGFSDEDRKAVVSTFKAQQRVFAVADDPVDTVHLMEAGYSSAHAIARDDFETFSARSGLTFERAHAVYNRANGALAGVSAMVGSIIDIMKGGFRNFGVGNIFEDVTDALRNIEGYADLFGSQDTCDCDHCQSILSPAAYFVDLMYFIEEHVSSKEFTGAKKDHALNLEVRRPDLWTLDLTCENTNTLIPTLDIINEILESYIAKRAKPSIDLSNRADVRDTVYTQRLAKETASFQTPFSLATATVDAYLEPFERTRADLLRAVGLDGTPLETAAILQLSKPEYSLIATANPDWPYLKKLYKTEFTVDGGGNAAAVDVQAILPFSDLSRDELGTILDTRTVRADGARNVRIVSQKRDASSIQNDVERVLGLNADALDLAQRFTRLLRHLPWSVAELDLVLKQRSPAAAPVIDAAALDDVAAVLGLTQRFGLSVEEACVLWSTVPNTMVAKGRPALFDKLFNNRPYILTEGVLPKDAVSFVHPAFRASATPLPADNTLQRLLLGLQLSEEAFSGLIEALAGSLGANLAAANEDDRGFLLTAANLSLLARHARLMKLTRRSASELSALIGLAGIAGGAIASLDDLHAFLSFDDWARTSSYTLDDILVLTGKPPFHPEKYATPTDVAASIVDSVTADGALLFADTVFAFVPNVTEDMSRQIVAANAGLFETQPQGMLRLKASTGINPALVVPAGVPASVASLALALARYHVATILPSRIAARLGLELPKFASIAAMVGVDLGAPTMAMALQGGARSDLEAALAALLTVSVLLKPAPFTPERIAFINANRSLFNISTLLPVTIDTLRAVAGYRTLIAPTPAPSPENAPSIQAVEEALLAFSDAQKFSTLAAGRLAEALGTQTPVATTLASVAGLGAQAIPALTVLATLVAITRDSGIGADSIKLLVSQDEATLDHGAEALVSALRQRFPEDKDFDDRLEPLDNRLRSRKRDALADGVIRASDDRFTTLDDLYAYFLVDVQLQGCARTSRVVGAMSSLQTYVHRILLNLEQDRKADADPEHVHVLPSRIPEDEWSWRKNYRVWEANRKVFLWPENYIEPELRDDKTPLFKALEDNLLQQDVNEQNVLDAYGDYLNGFEEVASLKIAGSFHEMSTGSDVLHVFGCTPSDPPVYYYWTVSNLYASWRDPDQEVSYSSRRKIDVSIPVRTVSPIVYLGRMFLFWNEIATASDNRVTGGESKFVGYKHKLTTKFTSLRLDGAWTPPQNLKLLEKSYLGSGSVVGDNLTYHSNPLTYGYPRLSPDNQIHSEYQEGYTLRGFHWEKVYPAALGSSLFMTSTGHLVMSQADLFDRKQEDISSPLKNALGIIWGGDHTVLHVGRSGASRKLYAPYSKPKFGWNLGFTFTAFQALTADIDTTEMFFKSYGVTASSVQSTYIPSLRLDSGQRGFPLATLRDTATVAQAVGGANSGCGLILQTALDSAYVFKTPLRSERGFEAHRLGTTLARDLSRILFTGGVNKLLDISTQKTLGEDPHLLTDPGNIRLVGRSGALDFTGPMGVYYREVFFHIPFLIADNLNARQNFAAAQNWYHYIFDPTATLDPGVSLGGLSAGQRQKVLRDRVWRYIEFRNLTAPKMRDILTDQAAIKAYKEDPFNPHAIARLRLSAYQKSVVMKYVGNLIDWGDSLFQQFTMESVNEALVLYVMASEILGRRPADIGDCGEGAVHPKNYRKIRPSFDRGSEFLLEVESVYWVGPKRRPLQRSPRRPGRYVTYQPSHGERVRKVADDLAAVVKTGIVHPVTEPRVDTTPARGLSQTRAQALEKDRVKSDALRTTDYSYEIASTMMAAAVPPAGETAAARREGRLLSGAQVDSVREGVDVATLATTTVDASVSRQVDWKKTRAVSWVDTKGATRRVVGNDSILINDFRRAGRFGWGIVRQLGPVFCVPQNKDLVALWDRVEDRLYKIRHCLDITGERRNLALFAPEIDPRLLVRARAQGLSIDDILGAASGNLPPYRFAYLIEKAKQYASAVQGFGAHLLSTLEKKDGEELAALRNTQQLNMLNLTTRLREWELKAAEEAIAQLELQKAAVEYRKGYYQGLLESGLNAAETAQQILRHGSTISYTAAGLMGGTAGVLSLIPQVGSPFAMKYGGVELGSSLKSFTKVLSDTAKLMDVFAASAGLEASFARRREGWDHQVELADQELKPLQKQIAIATIRRDMAARSIELHKTTIEEQQEIIDFFEGKFSNLGLYTWMSSTLQRLYRQTFNSAQAMAKLAERAFRFERGDDTTPLLQASYWDGSHKGLLAGEALIADLQNMEQRFVETNYRTLEIDQAFSLMQLSPAQLLTLRETGECEVAIPEVAFDLFYPGHYARRIKAARLTIPCVAGPYTNISATLTLKQSFVRAEAKLGVAGLMDVPSRHTSSVATSTAQNDAGVFDFSFRDERYMPFEGAGAVSIWTVSLPKNFRPFDYQSINDAVIHLSYTARADGVFRQKVEDANAALEGTITNILSTQPIVRTFSLRQDFSSNFHRLINSAPGTQIALDFDDRALPIFLRGRTLTLSRALLLVRTGEGATAAGTAFKVNGATVSGLSTTPEFPGYRTANIQAALATGLIGRHTVSIEAAGDLAPVAPQPGDLAACDVDRLLDVVLYVEMTL